jgi:Tfp pilus assembly protein PilZ
MAKPALRGETGGAPADAVLEKIRIPFVRSGELSRGERTDPVFLVDVGLLGAFVETSELLRPEEVVRLTFTLPDNALPIVATCRVAWWHGAGDEPRDMPMGAGLAFVDVPAESRARLRDHLVQHCRGGRGTRRFARPWPGDTR